MEGAVSFTRLLEPVTPQCFGSSSSITPPVCDGGNPWAYRRCPYSIPPVGRRLPTTYFLFARATGEHISGVPTVTLPLTWVTGSQTTGIHTDTANVVFCFSYVIANYVVTLIL